LFWDGPIVEFRELLLGFKHLRQGSSQPLVVESRVPRQLHHQPWLEQEFSGGFTQVQISFVSKKLPLGVGTVVDVGLQVQCFLKLLFRANKIQQACELIPKMQAVDLVEGEELSGVGKVKTFVSA